MKCSNCNESLSSNASFCTNCGQKVTDMPKSNVNNNGGNMGISNGATQIYQQPKKSMNLKFMIPIAIIGIVIFAVGNFRVSLGHFTLVI